MLVWALSVALGGDALVMQPGVVVAPPDGHGPRLHLGRIRPTAWSHRLRLTLAPPGEDAVTSVMTLRLAPDADGWRFDVVELYEDGAPGATQVQLAAAAERAAPVTVVPDGRGGAAFEVPVPGEDPLDQALVATLWEVLRALPVTLPERGAPVGSAWTVQRTWGEPGGHTLHQEATLTLTGVRGRVAQVRVTATADTVDGAWAGDDLDVRLHHEVSGTVWLQRGAPLWTGARLSGETTLTVRDPEGADVQSHHVTLEIAAREGAAP